MNMAPASIHRLKNKLAIILGFCELLLNDLPDDSPHRQDVSQILEAGKSALADLPPLAAHELSDALDSGEVSDAGQ